MASSTAAGKFLRILSWTVLTLLSVIIIIPVAAFLYFDPNDYKEELSHFITDKSGLPLEIHGAIEMKYFPWLGFSVKEVSLPQVAAFGNGEFIKIDSLDFKVPVRELLNRQLIVETLTVKGLTVNLVKNPDGTTNWDLANQQVKQKLKTNAASSTKEPSTSNTPTNSSVNEPKKKKLSFALAQFDIQDSTISFNDKSTQERFSAKGLTLKGKQEQNRYPLKGQLSVEQFDEKKQQKELNGTIDFEGSVSIGEHITALFNTALALEFPKNPAAFRKITANLQVNVKPKTIGLDNIAMKVGDQDITGNASIPFDESAPVNFLLKMKALDLNKLNPSTAQNQTTEAAKVIKTQNNVVASPASSGKSKSGRSLTGEIHIDTLTTQNLQLTNVKAIVNKTNNLVKLNPVTANLFGGSLSAQITKALDNPGAPTLLQGDLNNIQIQPLLTALKNEKRLAGVANVNFNLAQNKDINGVVKVDIKNGSLEGIDVKYYLSLAQSLVSKNKTASEDTKHTDFGSLTATLKLHDQMVDNNDLTIQAPDFTANGEGSIYLNSKTIEYKLQAWRKHRDNQEHANDLPLAIRIKGSLSHPKVEPDVDLYLKKGLEQEIKKQLNKQVEKNLGKILGADNAAPSEEGQASPENQLQQKIEDKLNKGLNKLLKKKKKE